MSRTEKTVLICLFLLFWAGVAIRAYRLQRESVSFHLRHEAPVPSPGPGLPTAKMDLNRATLSDLEELPGIGPKLARSILDYRARKGPIRNLNELLNIQGFGHSRLKRLEPLLSVSAQQP